VAAVCVIIVNYRTPALTVDCLRSLEAEVRTIGACRVVVVDNASPDDSAAVIAQAIADNNWGGWAEFRPLEKNLGFAAGNNAVLQRELDSNPPDFFWLLNPDTVVRPGSLRPLLDYLQSHPHVGIVGSRLEDPDGTPQRSAFRFLTPASEFEQSTRFGITTWLLRPWQMAPPVRETPHPTDWVAGASMLVRREVFETAGLMDDRYFLYFEEVDFCLAARRAGWRCWYVRTPERPRSRCRPTGSTPDEDIFVRTTASCTRFPPISPGPSDGRCGGCAAGFSASPTTTHPVCSSTSSAITSWDCR
jgi:GT2 family glycosyltransferase